MSWARRLLRPVARVAHELLAVPCPGIHTRGPVLDPSTSRSEVLPHAFSNFLPRLRVPVPLTTERMCSTGIVGHLVASVPATTLAKAAELKNTAALRLYLPFIPELDQTEYRSKMAQGQNLFGGDQS